MKNSSNELLHRGEHVMVCNTGAHKLNDCNEQINLTLIAFDSSVFVCFCRKFFHFYETVKQRIISCTTMLATITLVLNIGTGFKPLKHKAWPLIMSILSVTKKYFSTVWAFFFFDQYSSHKLSSFALHSWVLGSFVLIFFTFVFENGSFTFCFLKDMTWFLLQHIQGLMITSFCNFLFLSFCGALFFITYLNQHFANGLCRRLAQ